MKLKNLVKVHIYIPEIEEEDGESRVKWLEIFPVQNKNYYFNIQQDVSELDMNSAGFIDYDVLKLRSDKYFGLKKKYGVSLAALQKDKEGYLVGKPSFFIKANPRIGNSITYICNTYLGE